MGIPLRRPNQPKLGLTRVQIARAEKWTLQQFGDCALERPYARGSGRGIRFSGTDVRCRRCG